VLSGPCVYIKVQRVPVASCHTQDVLSELFKSAEIRDQTEKVASEPASSDGKPYRRQLTVEELFKGAFSILFLNARSASI